MSADNGVYIWRHEDGRFRVKEGTSLYPEDMSNRWLDSHFADAEAFDTLEAATIRAANIATELDVCEHGVCLLPREGAATSDPGWQPVDLLRALFEQTGAVDLARQIVAILRSTEQVGPK